MEVTPSDIYIDLKIKFLLKITKKLSQIIPNVDALLLYVSLIILLENLSSIGRWLCKCKALSQVIFMY